MWIMNKPTRRESKFPKYIPIPLYTFKLQAHEMCEMSKYFPYWLNEVISLESNHFLSINQKYVWKTQKCLWILRFQFHFILDYKAQILRINKLLFSKRNLPTYSGSQNSCEQSTEQRLLRQHLMKTACIVLLLYQLIVCTDGKQWAK